MTRGMKWMFTPTSSMMGATTSTELGYESKHLTGIGSIEGYPVKCISPEWMVKFHIGYELNEGDYRDVKALCDRFGIPLPAELKESD
jgi:hypothetical protein